MKRLFAGFLWSAAAFAAAQPLTLAASDPAVVGQWSGVLSWPAVAIHSHLLRTGKVLTWETGPTASIWDPATGSFTSVPNPWVDLLCAGNTFLPDGRLITLGGWDRTSGLGLTEVDLFDPVTESWSRAAPMTYKRWYPTGTVLPDGRILVTSGDRNALNDIVAIPEVYDPAANAWTSLPQAANAALPVYPFMYVLPDGLVISVGTSEVAWDTEVLDLATQTWISLDSRVIDGGSVAMFQPWKFMKAGSAADDGNTGLSVATAFVLDLTQVGPSWRPTTSMAYPRSFLNLTMLPDGTVLCTGGGTDRTGFDTSKAILPAELWSPVTETWTTLASMQTPRLYHSTALLLPDARVVVAGGGGDPGVVDQLSAEVFSPPYLFKGPRPTLAAAPSTLSYGSNFFVATPDTSIISSVSLIAPASVTHSFNQNERFLQLSFQATPGGISVAAPANSMLAPPGYYLLFLVNGSGVPSIGAFVNLPVPSSQPPVVVPDVVSQTQTGAIATIMGAGLVAGTVTSASSATLPAGSVIGQNPAAGTSVPAGSAVNLVVSSGPPSAGPVVDQIVFSDGSGTRTSPAFSTSNPGEVVVAFATSDGPTAGGQSLTISGAGLNWTLLKRINTQLGTSEIWAAIATNSLANVTVTCTATFGGFQQFLTVATFSGAAGTGATGGASGASGAPTVSLTTTQPGSLVYGVGDDWDAASARTVGPNQAIVHQYLTPSGDTFWVQNQTGAIALAGTQVQLNDTAPTTDRWNLAAVEILPAAAPTPDVTVPNVLNLTQAAATGDLMGAGLVVGTVSTASCVTVPAGSVVNQNPVAGTQVPAGSAVNLVISTGPPPLVAVPSVVNLTRAAAAAALTGARLVVGTVSPASSKTVRAGSVISQNPAAGTQVPARSAVSLVVSTGSPSLARAWWSEQ